MHHVGSEEVSELYAFDQEKTFSAPVRIRDLYYRFVEPRLAPSRTNWDNLSDDTFYLNSTAMQYQDWELARAKKEGLTEVEQKAHLSFIDCGKACQENQSCLQYRFHQGICAFSSKIKHGHPTKKEEKDEDRWLSGWNVDRIREWVKTNDHCKPDFAWPLA